MEPVPHKGPVAVAMSGGADSALTALLLQEAGWDVFGLHALLTPQAHSIEPVETLCRKMGIPLQVADLKEAFLQDIIQPFVESYRQALTPNPCIWCNPKIKMGRLWEAAKKQGAEMLATGHYVRQGRPEGCSSQSLKPGRDTGKDQSYFLYRLGQEQLARLATPLGHWTKAETLRELSRRGYGDLAERAESQEICFIPDDDYRGFLEPFLNEAGQNLEGPILDIHGRELGRHPGIHHYTIGQRRGLGVSAPEPLYVVEIRPEEKAVVAGPAEALESRVAVLGDCNWMGRALESRPDRVRVKIRYRSPAVPARLEWPEAGGVQVIFESPQRAVTPGQSAVLYDEEQAWLLGGGFIVRALP